MEDRKIEPIDLQSFNRAAGLFYNLGDLDRITNGKDRYYWTYVGQFQNSTATIPACNEVFVSYILNGYMDASACFNYGDATYNSRRIKTSGSSSGVNSDGYTVRPNNGGWFHLWVR